MSLRHVWRLCICALVCAPGVVAQSPGPRPGARVLLDAHNAYPDDGRYADRLTRALATGTPLAIEQDLVWFRDPATGNGRSLVSHGDRVHGTEPTLERHFFQAIAPLMERALRERRTDAWPLVTLNLDFKTNEPEHHAAVAALLRRYRAWLTTAVRTQGTEPGRLDVGPLLVLTGEDDRQAAAFHDAVPVGDRVLVFGAVHTRLAQAGTPAEPAVRAQRELPDITPGPATNYRRWWNLPWNVVELGGQPQAGAWAADDEQRLHRLVRLGHDAGLWVRFYTLNGHDPADRSGGWSTGYNFGSLAAATRRWEAAVRTGVDFVAVDQYEAFARVLQRSRDEPGVRLEGVITRADYEQLFEREFDVPPGTRRIDIDLHYDDASRTVLDLGLRGPAGFRGWAGGGPQQVFVSAYSASYGYTPGPIEPGRWAVILGVANIREAVTASYSVSVRTSASPAAAWPTLRGGPGWYAGDLHAHSGHSDGRTTGVAGARIRVPAEHVFTAARAAGLDFVALTDHNTTSHWTDVDRLQPLFPGLLLLHGREVTTYRGHMNAFGERDFIDFRLGPGRPMRELAAEIAGTGALLSINHPLRPDDESCMGCGWNDRDDDTIGRMHAVEVVNGDDTDSALSGWTFWAGMLTRGHRLTAIGGSDEHTPDESADRRIGVPTTVVYADELSERAIVEGLRRGRVYIRTRDVRTPVLDVWAARGASRVEMGETAAPGALTLHATVSGTARTFEWIRNGEVLARGSIPASGNLSHALDAAPGDWYSLVIRDARGVTGFSSAIYVR